jgi:putative effector of murein hydrolase
VWFIIAQFACASFLSNGSLCVHANAGANTSVTAAVVVLTGLIGANFVQAAMDKLGLNDPIARGIGTASR